MYKITESWQVSCPADVIPAVKVLRDSFAESHWKVGTITQQLTYSVLHEEGEKGIEVNLPRLIELKQIAGPVAAKRFNETIRIGTPPATFRAFLNLYQDMLTVAIIKIFEHLLEIGEANRQNLRGNYWDWARQQCLHLIHWEDHHIAIWVRECCDVQVSDPTEDRMEAIQWKNWQAPKLLTMTPVHTAPYKTESAWERLNVEDSHHLLRHFETFYALHLELYLKRAWEGVMVRLAKQPQPMRPADPVAAVSSSEVVSSPLGPSDTKKRGSARLLQTQKKHDTWKREYRRLRKQRAGMPDTWYSRQIAKLAIADGASSETIRKNMK